MNKGFFITGTDTDAGKTWCTLGLMAKLQQQGNTVIGMKPIASGCDETPDGLRNSDALSLQQQSSVDIDYEMLNPYSFLPPIAPHVAAEQKGERIKIGKILEHFIELKRQANLVIVEGVGGWQVPLNDNETIADLASALQLPVVLVVGLKLGCINHALLTAESIRTSGCKLVGWIANSVDKSMLNQQDNIDAIQQRIHAPFLGTVPHMESLNTEAIANRLEPGC